MAASDGLMIPECSPPVPDVTVRTGAAALQTAYDAYTGAFQVITRRAKALFEARDWKGVLQDAEARIGLYHEHLNRVEAFLRRLLGPGIHDEALWARMKACYLEGCRDRYDTDLALIFFYSAMRRVYEETGASIEYADDEIRLSRPAQMEQNPNRPARVYPADRPEDITPGSLRRMVLDFRFRAPFLNLAQDARLAAELLRPELKRALAGGRIDRIEMLEPAFYRNKAAYLIGRVVAGRRSIPLVLVLLNTQEGIVIDSALSAEADLSNVFTSARSNFHTDTTHYREVLDFLQAIAPGRPKAYICTAIGFIHPGKLELVHELRRHLAETNAVFRTAPGVPGTVMIVFSLPRFGYVFKTIRDISTKPSFLGRQHVIERYWRVHRTDRVGRMLDVMSFHNLRFRRTDFDPELLTELLREAPGSVRAEGDSVVFRYLYAQREIAPLDVFLADPARTVEERDNAVSDYGCALKDLAAAGIFVGDYLPKNFGVNRTGRVMLYDYDDLDDLVRWNFRKLPDPPEWAEMLGYDAWLCPGEHDVFPEHDFRIFAVPAHGREAFLKEHADLLEPAFWNGVKAELIAGRVPDFFPYPQRRRLRARLVGGECVA